MIPESVVDPELMPRDDAPMIFALITPPVEVIGPVSDPPVNEPPARLREKTLTVCPLRSRNPLLLILIGENGLKAVDEPICRVTGN